MAQRPFRSLLPFLAIALFAIACEQDPTQSEQYKQLEQDRSRTEDVVHMKDSTINDLFGTFNRISENLRTIREKQGQLGSTATTGPELGKDMEQHIMDDIHMIDSLLEQNKALIAKLRKDAKKNGGRIAELTRTVEELERTVAEKDTEIGSLKDQLASTNASLAELIGMYRDKEQLADLQRNELNTAWYAVGSAKELRENGVLTKEGGIAGIGASNKLNAAGLNKEYFKQVDIMQVNEIPINAKKAKLATSHPAGSYRMEGQVDKLVITDPAQFWSMSKYLVIVVD